MRDELKAAFSLAGNLPAEELPRLLGDLAEISATATARLNSPAAATPQDQNLKVPEAAHRLGVSPDYLYRNHKKFPFTRREGRKLLFSSNGLAAYLKKAR